MNWTTIPLEPRTPAECFEDLEVMHDIQIVTSDVVVKIKEHPAQYGCMKTDDETDHEYKNRYEACANKVMALLYVEKGPVDARVQRHLASPAYNPGEFVKVAPELIRMLLQQ